MRVRSSIVTAAFFLVSLPSFAEKGAGVPANPTYQQECASCHVPFPPALLDASAWRELLNGLYQHFGSDASLEPGMRDRVEKYLADNASRSPRFTRLGKPTLRITETAWFQREHAELGTSVWKRPSIKTASNCAACHSRAESGSFSERDIHIAK